MKAHLTATDWPRADDPAYLAGIRAEGDYRALEPCPFTGKHGPFTGGLTGMTEDALGHLYLEDGSTGVFGDGSRQCGCGARAAKGDE